MLACYRVVSLFIPEKAKVNVSHIKILRGDLFGNDVTYSAILHCILSPQDLGSWKHLQKRLTEGNFTGKKMCFGRRDTKLLPNYSRSLLLILSDVEKHSTLAAEGFWGSLEYARCVHTHSWECQPCLPPGWMERQSQSSVPLQREEGPPLLGPQPSSKIPLGSGGLLNWGGKNDFDVKNECIGYCLKHKVSALELVMVLVMLIHWRN